MTSTPKRPVLPEFPEELADVADSIFAKSPEESFSGKPVLGLVSEFDPTQVGTAAYTLLQALLERLLVATDENPVTLAHGLLRESFPGGWEPSPELVVIAGLIVARVRRSPDSGAPAAFTESQALVTTLTALAVAKRLADKEGVAPGAPLRILRDYFITYNKSLAATQQAAGGNSEGTKEEAMESDVFDQATTPFVEEVALVADIIFDPLDPPVKPGMTIGGLLGGTFPSKVGPRFEELIKALLAQVPAASHANAYVFTQALLHESFFALWDPTENFVDRAALLVAHLGAQPKDPFPRRYSSDDVLAATLVALALSKKIATEESITPGDVLRRLGPMQGQKSSR